ncbi:MAG: succinylglutamate desuccinylase/aspartoacylase family protein [Rhodobacteraceae bacterium]|jgi:predicted deacylase|nr:succinylglutamate desuccinylase/aspartoacylase family protein [Paracoccaceae bacterium]
MRQPDFSSSRLTVEIDLTHPGRRSGSFGLVWSDNTNPLGVWPIPAMVIVGSPGPTVLLIGGVHGDEYEGPAALARLYQALAPEEVTGRLIFLPALNLPAVRAGTRCSPLDGGNLNRMFPGLADGGPTAQIAHLVAACLMPICDAVIDLHNGGTASWFLPCALPARAADGGLDAANMALARAFGTGVAWLLGAANDNRSVNGAATAAGVPCIAAELGGGGSIGIAPLALAETGLRRVLVHLGVLPGALPETPPPRLVELTGPASRVVAPVEGLFLPERPAGRDIAAGERLGRIVAPERPDDPPVDIIARTTGLILAETRRAAVRPGAFLALIATDVR